MLLLLWPRVMSATDTLLALPLTQLPPPPTIPLPLALRPRVVLVADAQLVLPLVWLHLPALPPPLLLRPPPRLAATAEPLTLVLRPRTPP